MNIIERGRAFVQGLAELTHRPEWDWRRCPGCGDTDTIRNGIRKVHPWTLEGRKTVRIQRHLCYACGGSYSECSALLVRGSWYAREVHRFAVDHWVHVGSSLRRTAEIVRSLLGRQERWLLWRFGSVEPAEGEKCHLGQATVERWLDRAGIHARKSVPGQLEGVSTSGQVATDGLWARLLAGQKRVVLALGWRAARGRCIIRIDFVSFITNSGWLPGADEAGEAVLPFTDVTMLSRRRQAMAARYRILITDYAWPSLDPERAVFDSIGGADLVVSPGGQESSEAQLIDLAQGVDAIMTNWAKVTEGVIGASPRCKIVARYGVGVDNIDVEAATRRGIVVTNVPAYCVDEVSDHAMALLLAQARRVMVYDRAVRSGVWDVKAGNPVRRIHGKTLGILGLGKIGACLAAKARAFGLSIIAYDPFLAPEEIARRGAAPVDFPTFLAESDFISIHAPLSQKDGTSGLFGAEEFRAMKKGAYLINTARGGIIDEAALYQALKSGEIAGAALDVLPTEPISPDSRLLELDNLLLTPHAAFWSEESVEDLQSQAAGEVARALTGQPVLNPVNPRVPAAALSGNNGHAG